MRSPVHEIRSESKKNLEEKGVKKKKIEEWKYKNIEKKIKKEKRQKKKKETSIELKDVKKK